jgi:hypothetical protein
MKSNKIYTHRLATLVVASFFSTTLLAQSAAPKAFTPKIKTPNTKQELKVTEPAAKVEEAPQETSSSSPSMQSASPRQLRKHGVGIGLGQTFLLGNYADYGDSKITADLLYTYAASYSFDILVDAHYSQHKSSKEKMKLMGLNGAIKARLFEFDNFSPFVLGGLGFYAPQAKRNIGGTQKWSEQKLGFGMNFGGGVDLRLNDHYVVGILGQVHWPFTIKQDSQSDLKGYYFKLLITGIYLF